MKAEKYESMLFICFSLSVTTVKRDSILVVVFLTAGTF